MTRSREAVLAALVLAPIALLAGVIVIGAATRNEGPRTPIRRDSPETTGETADTTPDADSPEAPAAESSAVDEPIADGTITTIRGALPPGLSVKVASGGLPRLHIKLPRETDFHPFYGASLALAYRDSDDGSSVERVIATSRIRTGTLAEIGRVYEAPLDLRCALRTGRLERNRPARDPLRPLAP